MSASVSRERRQTRSSTALNNSNLEPGSEYSSKRKLSNKEPIDSEQFRKSHRTKVLSPNENELSTVKPKFIKEKINGDQNVLKSVNNPETSASNVSSSSSSTSASSDSKPTSVSTRRRSANLLNQMSSASLDQMGPASRKRNLSTSQEVKNENENEPCSQSANASSSGVSALVQSPSSSSLNKRIKLKHKYAFKELNENTNSPTTFRLMSKDEYEQNSPYGDREDASLSEINEADETKEDDVKESLICPVLGCKSDVYPSYGKCACEDVLLGRHLWKLETLKSSYIYKYNLKGEKKRDREPLNIQLANCQNVKHLFLAIWIDLQKNNLIWAFLKTVFDHNKNKIIAIESKLNNTHFLKNT
ncbi:hypothetical protein BpHYR1_023108 [Brachionus plicatilis]|uniref:Uncharacterized protein n=1 Tax=Brachionus plicatilis TaxID=10195 RepID=A0A3M7PGE7_BRAPC|nr:hypothetical protein BpHYR1_023108 [Brachionus plicatilis]